MTNQLKTGADNNGTTTEKVQRDNPRKPIPPEWQAVLDQKLAPNGLEYRPFVCQVCGHHFTDQAVLMGVLRKKCPDCKYPNVFEVNRVGEDALMELLQRKNETSGGGAD